MNIKTLPFLLFVLFVSFSVFAQDSDGDGLSDDDEVNIYGTDPYSPDTDGDEIDDYSELVYWGDNWDSDTDEDGTINLLDNDSDNDNLFDGSEIIAYLTNPAIPDTDEDGLLDGEEVNTYYTDPLDTDTDDDMLSDGEEVLTYNTNPLSPDTDGDGLTDGEEVNTYSTDPLDNDTDDDELGDFDEVYIHSTDPLVGDTDEDNLTDGDEVMTYNTNPLEVDTDFGGVSDGDEVLLCETDPNNPSDDALPTSSEVDIDACDSYTSELGNVYTESGTYTETIPDAEGCYDVLTINFTINVVDASVSQNANVLTATTEVATYQWVNCDDNNSIIENETNQTFTATGNGNYAVIVTQNSCSETSECLLVNTIEIESQDISSIKVYPIPSENNITIDFVSIIKNATIYITDITGKLVYSSDINNKKTIKIDLEQLSGFYILNIETNSSVISKKIILK